jgi:ferric-dicitrate binding protein FerR (iron transport regulator)
VAVAASESDAARRGRRSRWRPAAAAAAAAAAAEAIQAIDPGSRHELRYSEAAEYPS